MYKASTCTESHHGAFAFFINAVIDPTIVLSYAKTNHVPGPSKDYTRQHLGGRGTLGWIAPYMARFSKHPTTLRLRKINGSESYLTLGLETAVLSESSLSEWIGVDARCFYADFDDDSQTIVFILNENGRILRNIVKIQMLLV